MNTLGQALFIAGELTVVGFIAWRSWHAQLPTRAEGLLMFAALLLGVGTLIADG